MASAELGSQQPAPQLAQELPHPGSAAVDGGEAAPADAIGSASEEATTAAAAAVGSLESLRELLPMIPLSEGGASRRGRLLRYPQFNLTWTRGAPPPRSGEWAPTAAERRALPSRDLKEKCYRSCAVVGSSGTLRRSGYGRFIDAHEMVIRFNGAPAGGGYGRDVGARTGLSILADVTSTECLKRQSRQPVLSQAARMDGALLQEADPEWRTIAHCDFYAAEGSPPTPVLFLPKRGSVRRLLEYAIEHPEMQARAHCHAPTATRPLPRPLWHTQQLARAAAGTRSSSPAQQLARAPTGMSQRLHSPPHHSPTHHSPPPPFATASVRQRPVLPAPHLASAPSGPPPTSGGEACPAAEGCACMRLAGVHSL